MSGPLSSAGAGSFTSSLKAISDLGKTADKAASDLQDIDFSELIEQQNAVPGLLEALKGLLPEQDFSQIEAFVNGGNSLPAAADSGGEFNLFPGELSLPVAATLAVAQQQIAAAQMAGETLTPAVRTSLPETGQLPVLMNANAIAVDALSGMGTDATKTILNGLEQALPGITPQLLKTDFESFARTRRSTLQESASAATANPMSALSMTETAATMRLSSPAPLQLDTPLATRGWEQGVGDRILWMLGNSLQGASLRISPAHLGPIEIQLSMHQDQATVTFNAQHAVVREALEASIPRLREMFQENNLQLAHVDIGQSGNSERQAAGGDRGGQNEPSGDVLDGARYDDAGAEDQVVIQSIVDGLLNDYA